VDESGMIRPYTSDGDAQYIRNGRSGRVAFFARTVTVRVIGFYNPAVERIDLLMLLVILKYNCGYSNT
jgi:hypothetical protein